MPAAASTKRSASSPASSGVQAGAGCRRCRPSVDADDRGTATAAPTAAAADADDPATSPYPIWNVNQAYPKGTKIVWHRNVYQAKWYTTGDQPDIPVAAADQTPWTLDRTGPAGRAPGPAADVGAGHLPGLERDRRLCRRQSGAAGRSRL